MFDFTAGTSTASIIAAGLAMPNKTDINQTIDCSKTLCEPKFFADDLIKIYSEKGHIIFQKYAMSGLNTFISMMLILIVLVSVFYYLGARTFDCSELTAEHKALQQLTKILSSFGCGKSELKQPLMTSYEGEE